MEDPISLAAICFFFLLTVYLILEWTFTKLKIMPRIKCRLGKHTWLTNRLRKTNHYYYCIICRKPRKDRNLTLIDGGKKDIGTWFKF